MPEKRERGSVLKGLAWLICLTGVYALLLAAITLLNWSGAERYWFGALNLFLPQFMWALPGFLLAFFFFKADSGWVWLPILCIAWVLGPIMGFSWPTRAVQSQGQTAVRVMTWNIKYGNYDLAPLMEEISRCKPDVVFFQDAIAARSGALGSYFKNWQVASHGQYLIASRFPLTELEVRELPTYGDRQEYLYCRLHLGQTVVSLYNVHLRTPRRSLNTFRTVRKQPWNLPYAINTFSHNVNTRLKQGEAVRDAIAREKGPTILAGDLNAPEASQVITALRGAGLQDAFAQRGKGYGFTYGHFLFKHRLPWLKISWMRIDHIMANGHFKPLRSWTGTGEASDHRPVIADLVLQHL
jgi:vancomycin resistance protein VanJ